MQVKNLKTFVYSRLTEKYNYNPIAFTYIKFVMHLLKNQENELPT